MKSNKNLPVKMHAFIVIFYTNSAAKIHKLSPKAAGWQWQV